MRGEAGPKLAHTRRRAKVCTQATTRMGEATNGRAANSLETPKDSQTGQGACRDLADGVANEMQERSDGPSSQMCCPRPSPLSRSLSRPQGERGIGMDGHVDSLGRPHARYGGNGRAAGSVQPLGWPRMGIPSTRKGQSNPN